MGWPDFEDFSLDSLVKVLQTNRRENFSLQLPFSKAAEVATKAIPSLFNLDIITYGRCAEIFVLHHWSDNNSKLIKNSCLAGRSDGSFLTSRRISFAENLWRTFFCSQLKLRSQEVKSSEWLRARWNFFAGNWRFNHLNSKRCALKLWKREAVVKL